MGLVSARHPKVLVDYLRYLSASKEPILLCSFLLVQGDLVLEIRALDSSFKCCGDLLSKSQNFL